MTVEIVSKLEGLRSLTQSKEHAADVILIESVDTLYVYKNRYGRIGYSIGWADIGTLLKPQGVEDQLEKHAG